MTPIYWWYRDHAAGVAPQEPDNSGIDVMRMQVSEQGDEVFIELFGVAGRHQRILQVLTQGPAGGGAARGYGLAETPLETADITVRAGSDEMHIRLKGRAGKLLEALSIYRYLRHELVEREILESF